MDRDRNSIREMEQIQKGLEDFLENEMQSMKQKERTEPRFFDLEEERDRKTERYKKVEHDRTDERLRNLYDEVEEYEHEEDFAGEYEDDYEEDYAESEEYIEDWDSRGHEMRRTQGRTQNSQSRATGRDRSNSQRRAADRNRNDSQERAISRDRSSSQRREADRDGSRRNSQSRTVDRDRNNASQGKKKKKHRLRKFLITILVLLALLAGGAYYLVGKVYTKMNYEEISSVTTAPMKQEGVVNILLIGNDSRENGEDGRSDAMILVSINHDTKKLYMTSLLRDMYVDIPGHKGNRLNAAYSYGGAELLMDTIEQNFDITINRYMLVNFEAFANLVDAVGGVKLELSKEEIEYVNAYLVEYNILTGRPEGTDYMDTSTGGVVHLNGPQALAYSRNRYLGTDFGRTERQRKVLEAVIKQLPATLLTNPVELMNGLLPNLTTNLTQKECYQLSLMGTQLLGYDLVQGSIPLEGTYKNATIREMAVLEVDFEANKQYIKDTIYGKASKEE